MQGESPFVRAARQGHLAWARIALIALIVEKIVQHSVVTAAFAFDWRGISATVAVNPALLMVLGAGAAVAFAVSLWGLLTRGKWVIDLVIALALFDIAGEFVAQGKIGISMTVSFLMAIMLLILALLYRRQEPKGTA